MRDETASSMNRLSLNLWQSLPCDLSIDDTRLITFATVHPVPCHLSCLRCLVSALSPFNMVQQSHRLHLR